MKSNKVWILEYKTPTSKHWTSGINFFYWTKQQAKESLNSCYYGPNGWCRDNPVIKESATGTKWRISTYRKV